MLPSRDKERVRIAILPAKISKDGMTNDEDNGGVQVMAQIVGCTGRKR